MTNAPEKVCIYHANCADGFGAALAVYKSAEWGPRTTFIAAHYNDEPPDVRGKDVIIVDFSYPRDTLIAMYNDAASLLVIDHHTTAMQACEALAFCVFDLAHSGAWLTWNHLHGEIPRIIEYIEDRDLWTWKLPGSKEVSAALRCHDMRFANWETLLNDAVVEQLKADGGAILHYQRKEVASIIEQWRKDPAYIELSDGQQRYAVPTLNTTTLISEVGHALCKDAPFSATYFIRNDGALVYSLRSQEDGVDVSEVAKQYGGGGHKRAAGFLIEDGKPWNLFKSA